MTGNALRVMTWNIRTSLADAGRKSDRSGNKVAGRGGSTDWDDRKTAVTEMVLSHDPDLVGFQEPTERQWKDLKAALGEGWDEVVHSRADTFAAEPHLQGFFLRRGRFTAREKGCFWLSDSPDIPGSITFPSDWGARTVSWGRIHDGSAGRDLVFAVTHFDTNGGFWLPAAKVLAEELRFIAGPLPQVAVGDYNCAAGSEAWRFLTGKAGFRDAWTVAGLKDEGVTTFNAFTEADRLPLDRPGPLREWMDAMAHGTPQFAHYPGHVMEHRNYRIDWILLRNGFTPRSVTLDTAVPGGVIPSDHFPVVAELEWD